MKSCAIGDAGGDGGRSGTSAAGGAGAALALAAGLAAAALASFSFSDRGVIIELNFFRPLLKLLRSESLPESFKDLIFLVDVDMVPAVVVGQDSTSERRPSLRRLGRAIRILPKRRGPVPTQGWPWRPGERTAAAWGQTVENNADSLVGFGVREL